MTKDIVADIVIVGAGSAGSTLAGRLSEQSDLSVLLIEAGTRSLNPWLQIPIGYVKTIGDARHDWNFSTEPDGSMAGRRIGWPRGKGVGGSSLINGMLYLRGHRKDYDGWAALGNAGWDWDSVRPYFDRALATAVDGHAGGSGGPLSVSRLPRDPLSDAFVEAASRCQIPPTDDFNGGDNTGAGYFTVNTRGGRRLSAARAYLNPARRRPNLRILTGVQATRIVIEKGRAVGVEVVRGQDREVHRADQEVVLCCGAVQSPHLLQLSGLGDPALLGTHGIRVEAPIPGVGQNLQDHLQLRPVYRVRGVETLNQLAHSRRRGARELATYLLGGGGALGAGIFRAGAFFSSGPDQGWPDTQIHFCLLSFEERGQPLHAFPGITVSACALRPKSRGRVEIRSADPLAPPAIYPCYMTAPEDRALAVATFRRVRQIVGTQPLAGFIAGEHEPGPQVESEAGILSWIERRAGSIFHPVGTCAMGPGSDPAAVVDERLRVRGVGGLRVVDGSVMPRLVSGNTNAPIMMIAERAADLMRADLRA